jgi:SYF2 splicing factor
VKNRSAALSEAEGGKNLAAFEVSGRKQALKQEKELEAKEALEMGVDPDRHLFLTTTVGEAQRTVKKSAKKRKNAEEAGVKADVAYASYKRRLRDLTADLQKEYQEKKQVDGNFYRWVLFSHSLELS